MILEENIRTTPRIAASLELIKQQLMREKSMHDITDIRIVKRSIDARQKNIFVNLRLQIFINESYDEGKNLMQIEYKNVGESKQQVIVVGAGPAGLFAALKLLELGVKPIVIERGKRVSERKIDLAQISRNHIVNPESNYSFGEGGAGAFSDGKLYTRSKKRGPIDKILNVFCIHGASPNILIDAHPHIGTDKLPKVIANIRERILSCGGEMYFETRVDELIREGNKIIGVKTSTNKEFFGPVILATGHSARDVYRYLHKEKIFIQPKGIAVGVRLEHPQHLIDQLQYHSNEGRGQYLPAAEYSFVEQVNGRGVYSFCMCPGGFVIPAASGPNQVVVNGMSPSNRNSKWSNSGMVVEIHPEDLKEKGDLAMIDFQEKLEEKAYIAGGKCQKAPAQRMGDFVKHKTSNTLPISSYVPGLESVQIDEVLPHAIAERLRMGFTLFDRKTKGFLTNEACLIGVETRTSSPIRITRNNETLQHVEVEGLFPCGEGAGYAGGIVSAAVDGERCAIAAASFTSLSI